MPILKEGLQDVLCLLGFNLRKFLPKFQEDIGSQHFHTRVLHHAGKKMSDMHPHPPYFLFTESKLWRGGHSSASLNPSTLPGVINGAHGHVVAPGPEVRRSGTSKLTHIQLFCINQPSVGPARLYPQASNEWPKTTSPFMSKTLAPLSKAVHTATKHVECVSTTDRTLWVLSGPSMGLTIGLTAI